MDSKNSAHKENYRKRNPKIQKLGFLRLGYLIVGRASL